MAAHHCFGAGADERRNWLSKEAKAELEGVVNYIATPGKGISACDESGRTINPRLEAVGLTPSEELRRCYRQTLFDAPGAPDYLTAVILDPETVKQCADDGTPFPALLKKRGLLPGVKPSLTAAGCTFAKWRSPLTIDVAQGTPSALAIETNMRDLARYALICQAEGLVPIVEPDLVLKGDHSLEDAVEANARVNMELFRACADYGVYLEGAS
ncbi:3-phosphoinositide-dependent protein kinase [Aureococcus anophagefferens]|nr:3-phosphoinositide-dependent protein kinase [Aureococcus anophagefferens]